MEKGKVKWYDEVKGYGFIETSDRTNIFVHRSGLESPFIGLESDQQVQFKVKQGDKGPVAFQVTTVESEH